jgi:hypothetical protein
MHPNIIKKHISTLEDQTNYVQNCQPKVMGFFDEFHLKTKDTEQTDVTR